MPQIQTANQLVTQITIVEASPAGRPRRCR